MSASKRRLSGTARRSDVIAFTHATMRVCGVDIGAFDRNLKNEFLFLYILRWLDHEG